LEFGEHPDAKDMPNHCSSNAPIQSLASLPGWNGWSNDLTNARFQSAKAAGLSPATVSQLQFKWAFAFPSAASVYGQPTIVDGRVFASADSGYVYSLDATTGCVHWSFQAQSGVASAITIAKRPGTSTQFAAYFGDIRGNVYAVDASNGELLWKTPVDPHPLSRIRGGIKFYNDRLYIPVASLEEPESASANYVCCSFRGMVVAMDARSGKQIWKTYTIGETPTQRKKADGTAFIGPSGAGIWGPTMVDPKRKAIYVSTGNAFSDPDTGRSDAVIAMEMDTGKILWVRQAQPKDVWHTGCPAGNPPASTGLPPKPVPEGRGRGGNPVANRPPGYYCPESTENPDYDFSAGVMLANLPNGKTLLIVAQKAGMVWAYDPDKKGTLVWKRYVARAVPGGNGEIVFGGALDTENAYFALRSGGLVAVRLSTGAEKWFTPVPPQESMKNHSGLTAAVTLIPGVVFAAGLDGMARAFSTVDGKELWAYDTTQEVKTVNGITTKGGSIGSAGVTVADGMVFVPSGYSGFQGGAPANLLLAFGTPSR
jgi:polyvinyl alcohol dehydrogenase (cytochrome)